jgi:hypothetical protein
MGKYEPLPQFLDAQAATTLRMTFRQIERVLGFKLPNSAYRHEAWWSNNEAGHSHARTWLSSGWQTQDVDLAGRAVTFRRVGSSGGRAARKIDPWGCMIGTVTFMPGVDLTAPSGDEWNAEKGLLLNE